MRGIFFTLKMIGLLSTVFIIAISSAVWAQTHATKQARLVLQITVDALRADLPQRFARHYSEGGWRYLLGQGLNFVNAYYQHANTETIVGHATLATGADPSVHGMVGNVWLDRTDGRSPRAIRVSTFSDELATHYDGRSKVFGILVKDRGVLARFTMNQGSESAREKEPQITGTVWQWVQTLYNDDTKAAPADPKNYIVQFLEDGTINVKADCNQKGGTYTYSREEKRLAIEITRSTMAACPEGSLEDEFVRGLSGGAIYFIKDGDLYIDLKYDSGTMKFSERKEK